MAPHVRRKAAGLHKALAAHLTDKSLVAGARPLVLCQPNSAVEGLAAEPACIGFVTRVDLLVPLQGADFGESLAAHIADKRLPPIVDLLVPLQTSGHGKGLAAHVADEGAVTSVDPLVSLQASSPGENLGAHVAHVLAGFAFLHFNISSVAAFFAYFDVNSVTSGGFGRRGMLASFVPLHFDVGSVAFGGLGRDWLWFSSVT